MGGREAVAGAPFKFADILRSVLLSWVSGPAVAPFVLDSIMGEQILRGKPLDGR